MKNSKEKQKAALKWVVCKVITEGEDSISVKKFKKHHKCFKELKDFGLAVAYSDRVYLTRLGWQTGVDSVIHALRDDIIVCAGNLH